MSSGFASRWRAERLDEILGRLALDSRLRGLIASPFVREAGCLVLESLVGSSVTRSTFQDRTGYEAFVNKVHVEDFIDDDSSEPEKGLGVLVQQGVKAAVGIAERLEGEGQYRVLLSLDAESRTMTLRLFGRRAGEPWGPEDPDAIAGEELLIIDTGS